MSKVLTITTTLTLLLAISSVHSHVTVFQILKFFGVTREDEEDPKLYPKDIPEYKVGFHIGAMHRQSKFWTLRFYQNSDNTYDIEKYYEEENLPSMIEERKAGYIKSLLALIKDLHFLNPAAVPDNPENLDCYGIHVTAELYGNGNHKVIETKGSFLSNTNKKHYFRR